MWIIAIPEVNNSNFISVPEKSKKWFLSTNEIACDHISALSRVSAKFEFRYQNLKSKFRLILFVDKLVIGSS